MLRIFLLLAAMLLSSCSEVFQKTSPVIYFSNASSKPITGIHAIWADDNILTLNSLSAGDTRSQSFYIGGNSDFFGLVRISWTNSESQGVSREFFFRKSNLPEIDDDSIYHYVQIYLEQNDFEVISSNAADLENKTKRMDDLLKFYREKTPTIDQTHIPTSLIRVEPTREKSNPAWIERSF
jgi:hypothetical protein